MRYKRKRSNSYGEKALRSLEEIEGTSASASGSTFQSLRRNISDASERTNESSELPGEDDGFDQDYLENHYESGDDTEGDGNGGGDEGGSFL